MRIQLDIEDIVLNEPRDYLKHSDKFLKPLIECLEKLPFWNLIQYFGRFGSRKLKKIKDLNNLIKDSESWKNVSYLLASENEVAPISRIVLRPFPSSIMVQISIGEPHLSDFKEGLIDDLIEFTKSIYNTFKDKAIIGPTIGIKIHGIEYARPRPPHLDLIWESAQVVDFASEQFHSRSNEGNAEQLNQLKQTKLPDLASKLEYKDLIIIRWVENLIDSTKIANGLSTREKWFSETLELPIDSSFNKEGDEIESCEILEKHKYLTFYDSFTKIGYKGVVVNPDGSVDEELFEDIANWVLNSSTPDGTKLKHLNLITPDRESALFLAEKANTIGVKKVLYVDKNNYWWNPNPPGYWIE